MAKRGDVKVCIVCGKEFVCGHGKQQICSMACSQIREHNRNMNYKGAPEKLTRKCKYCGKEFPVNGKKAYCSDECRKLAYNAKQKEYARKKAEELKSKEPKPLLELKCKECGKTFYAKTRHQKYCSEECRKAACNRKEKELSAKKNPPKPKDFPCGNRDCKFAIKANGGMCNYLEMTGKLRRCPNTPDCEKYEKATGKRERRIKPVHLSAW